MVTAIVCGGRDFGEVPKHTPTSEAVIAAAKADAERRLLYRALDRARQVLGVTAIVQGGSRGADYWAYQWGRMRGVDVRCFPADWGRGPSGGPKRNQRMIDETDAAIVLAFKGGTGTADMVARAEKAGLTVHKIGWGSPTGGVETVVWRSIRVVAPHFVAGMDSNGTIHRPAPILAYMDGWPESRARAYIARKGWNLEVVMRLCISRRDGETWRDAAIRIAEPHGKAEAVALAFDAVSSDAMSGDAAYVACSEHGVMETMPDAVDG